MLIPTVASVRGAGVVAIRKMSVSRIGYAGGWIVFVFSDRCDHKKRCVFHSVGCTLRVGEVLSCCNLCNHVDTKLSKCSPGSTQCAFSEWAPEDDPQAVDVSLKSAHLPKCTAGIEQVAWDSVCVTPRGEGESVCGG